MQKRPIPFAARSAASLIIATALAGGGCSGGREHAVLANDAERWHADRLISLTADDGWLTLVGLCWLDEGPNGVGGRAAHRVHYDRLPEDVGVMTLDTDAVTFASSPGAPVRGVPADGRLVTDADGEPTVLTIGSISMHVIRRGDRVGVRIRDSESPVRLGFLGIERYPVDRARRIDAVFRRSRPNAWLPVTSVIGTVNDQAIAGRAEFEVNGHRCDLVLMPGAGPDGFFVVFGDLTNGNTTHSGGRFLEAALTDGGGTVVLDFNRAYNPPCAFTEYATCPLPVQDNLLPFNVEAGERRPSIPEMDP